jgi:hypothetical protein
MPITKMTRDGALHWLNVRVGKEASVVLSMNRGGWSIQPVVVRGLLRRAAEHGDELHETYEVGDDGVLNLSEMPDDAFWLFQARRAEQQLRVHVDEHAGIGIAFHP